MQPEHLLLYDGVCALCSRFVRLFVSLDRNRVFRYAPLQGETARFLRESGLQITSNLDSIVYVTGGQVHVQSAGILRPAALLPLPWSAVRVLLCIPAVLRDAAYRQVAASRYSVFGKYDACRIPAPEEIELFLP